MCAGILADRPVQSELIADLVKSHGAPSEQLWQSYVDGIMTPKEYIEFLQVLQKTASMEFPARYQYGSQSKGEDAHLHLLRSLDFVTPLLQMRLQMSAKHKRQILQMVESYFQSITTDNIPDRKNWQLLLQTIKGALDSRQMSFWIQNIPQDLRLVYDRNYFLQKSSLALLLNLPEVTRAGLKKQTWEKLAYAFQQEKKAHTEDGIEAAKTYRRNVETLHRILYHKELQQLMQLSPRSSRESLVTAIDAYWKSIYEPQWKDTYSFAKVLEIAKALQKSAIFKAVPEASIDIYGSLPNGKADLKSSDIDIHPDTILMTEYINMMTERIRDYSDPFAEDRHGEYRRSKEDIQNFSNILLETERQLAQAIGQSQYAPAQLMTIVPTSSDYFFKPEIINYYNPIRITVSKRGITVEIHDVLHPTGTRTVQIPVR